MTTQDGIIVMGASRGGLEAISRIVNALPLDLPMPIAIVLHTGADSPRVLDLILGARTELPVAYAGHGTAIEPGHIYLAPPNCHLIVAAPGKFGLEFGQKIRHSRPAVDRLFQSAARIYGAATIGVILTGGDGDGAVGLRAISERGGMCIIQDPAEAIDPSMPLAALREDHPDYSAPLEAIPDLLTALSHSLQPVTVTDPMRL